MALCVRQKPSREEKKVEVLSMVVALQHSAILKDVERQELYKLLRMCVLRMSSDSSLRFQLAFHLHNNLLLFKVFISISLSHPIFILKV